MLSGIAKYLVSVFEKFGTWLSAAGTLDDVAFNDWWMGWVKIKMKNVSYDGVGDEEGASDEAGEYPFVVELRNMEMWCTCSLLESEYELFQG